MVPMEMKNLKSLEDFKNKIRKWEPDGCDKTLQRLSVKFRIHEFSLIAKVFTKTDGVLGSANHVGTYLLRVDISRLHWGVKYERV